MARCMQCGKELTHNEIGAHRKFITRGAEQFFCKQCLAEHLGVTPELIDEKIEQFKRQGCTLFVCRYLQNLLQLRPRFRLRLRCRLLRRLQIPAG